MPEVNQTGQHREPSFDGLNRHGKLKYSWVVGLGPFKPGQIVRQLCAPQQPAGEGGAAGTRCGAPPGDDAESG